MQKIGIAALIVVIVIVIALVALVATGKQTSQNKTTNPKSSTNTSSNNTTSINNTALSGGGTGVYYQVKTAQGNGNIEVTLPSGNGNGEFLCFTAANATGVGIEGPEQISYGTTCNTTAGNAGGVVLGITIFNFTQSGSNPATYPPIGFLGGFNSTIYNYSIKYTNSLALTAASCEMGPCNLIVPKGCGIVKSTVYGNDSTYLMACVNQPLGTYETGVNYTQLGAAEVGTYVFH
ncbi:MAG: hypothetical protein M1504_01310 [Candidatus Marsarchaeota archaeon]|nr:hypothetical protein [Candidatus Marsarchaeota archaeon]